MTRKPERRKSALSLVALSLAAGLAPDPIMMPSAWAREHLVVADGPKAGQKWDPTQTPQLVDVLDCMATDSPANRVSVRKSHQVGFTQVAIAWMAAVIANTPARALVVFPTEDGAREFNSEKFHPALEETPALRRKVVEARSKSAKASTTLKKRFPGGTITLTGANSTADLRSKTVKFVFADEVDEWPLDLNGQGDPMTMVDARQTAFHATGEYKKLEGSTPTIKGASRIDAAFEEGDQRHWQVPCPHCGEYQRLTFMPDGQGRGGLRFSREYPYNAHYVCIHCGAVIEHHHKRAMVQAGRWVADNPGPGRHPSFHLDTLTSLLTTWDKLAEVWWKAQGDTAKLKAFNNLWLGVSWEERGEAPEWNRLYVRREDYTPRIIPPGGIIIVCGVDVQQDGVYYEVVAWGRDRQSWSIDAGYLEGRTDDPDGEVWRKLSEVHDRRYPDCYGNAWPIDAMAVDTGYNANQVYLWSRTKPRVFAIKGEEGWARPAISSTPSKVDINWRGRRMSRGAELWFVGTWSLKAQLYADLRKEGRKDGAELDPPGFCHFSESLHDERFFKQLTAEYLKEHTDKGRTRRVWHAAGPNHFHDCRIYAMAMAALKGVGSMTEAEWARWEAARSRPPQPAQGNLLAMMDGGPPQQPAEEPKTDAPAAPQGGGSVSGRRGGWLGGRKQGWIR